MSRPLKVRAIVAELIGRQHRVHAAIGYGMMLQLGGDVVFNRLLVGGAEAANRIIAAECLGPSRANQMLQAALDRAQAVRRRDVRLGADQELADVVLREAVLQDADAVGLRRLL
jgi:hypothetical protein